MEAQNVLSHPSFKKIDPQGANFMPLLADALIQMVFILRKKSLTFWKAIRHILVLPKIVFLKMQPNNDFWLICSKKSMLFT